MLPRLSRCLPSNWSTSRAKVLQVSTVKIRYQLIRFGLKLFSNILIVLKLNGAKEYSDRGDRGCGDSVNQYGGSGFGSGRLGGSLQSHSRQGRLLPRRSNQIGAAAEVNPSIEISGTRPLG